MQSCWVGQGKDDGTINVLCHFLSNLLCESSGLGTGSYQNVWLDFLNHIQKGCLVGIMPFLVIPGVVALLWGELVIQAFEKQARFVDAPELLERIFTGFVGLDGNRISNLITNASTCCACSKQDDAEVTELVLGHMRSLIKAANVTQPVPWTSSLKQAISLVYLSRMRRAFWSPKSSKWMYALG